MNITFLIGNGFDLNLGLKTKYSDFIEKYLVEQADDREYILKFKKDIEKDKKTWADAELAFGKYTSNFGNDQRETEKYCLCHEDYCEKLSIYLKEEEKRFVVDEKIVRSFFTSLLGLSKGITTGKRQRLNDYMDSIGGGCDYYFVIFNYTDTIDRIMMQAKKKSELLGTRNWNGNKYSNHVKETIHVHGTTNGNMVLGLNDMSQIDNNALFSDTPPEYISQIIKSKTNEMNDELIDQKVERIIHSSNLLYIYGMSIGDTDKRWWKTICQKMMNDTRIFIIIHSFEAPQNDVIGRRKASFERKMKERFLKLGDVKEDHFEIISNRVFVVSENIFQSIKNLTKTEIIK